MAAFTLALSKDKSVAIKSHNQIIVMQPINTNYGPFWIKLITIHYIGYKLWFVDT